MARSYANTGKTPFLPASFSAFVRRRLTEISGVALMATGALVAVALITYRANDPSFNVAVNGAPANYLGLLGAAGADLLLQLFGLASVLPALVLVCWGYRIAAKHKLSHAWLRLALLPAAMAVTALAAAGASMPQDWALPSGAGGSLGAWALTEISALAGLAELDPGFVLAGAIVIATILVVLALGLSWGEWLVLGHYLVWLMVAGARGASWAGQTFFHLINRAAARSSRGLINRRQRVEPHFSDDGEPHFDVHDRGTAATRPNTGLVAAKTGPMRPGKRAQAGRQATLDLIPDTEHQIPDLDLLELPPAPDRSFEITEEALAQNARILKSVLEDFAVRGEIIKVRPGPVVTLYELEPAPGIKSSRVIGLADDIARSMSAISVRIAVVPGQNVIGIELPNTRRETVYLRELLASESYERTAATLALVLGKDISGAPVIVDLGRMPHLLIAGTTGSGKSVGINTMILSLLYRLPPEECKFIMIDPKMLELSVYDGIPHLLAPVVTEPDKAVVALRWTVREMENRYRAMSQLGVRNITSYNSRLAQARKRGEELMRTVQTGFDDDTGKPVFEDQPLDLSPLPYIVVIVDEMADLMLLAGKEIETAVQRLSQMARAAGIHIIMATQRPSVDVITGTIKANLPTRISFQVTSKIDSRTILGEQGAEQLLGQGDMLYMAGGGRITRVHGPFVSDDEIEAVVNHLREQGEPTYIDEVTEADDAGLALLDSGDSAGDSLYNQAVGLVLRQRKASTSFIQRHLQIGYNRAARIMEQMETDGVVSPANHVGRREILIHSPEEVPR
ncbi:MAG: DNA translocase FtsK 4TM domain-containing protein [Alphaproteobacteria bacterium]